MWRLLPERGDIAFDVVSVCIRMTHSIAQLVETHLPAAVTRDCPLPQPSSTSGRGKMKRSGSCSDLGDDSSTCSETGTDDNCPGSSNSASSTGSKLHPLTSSTMRKQTGLSATMMWAHKHFMSKGTGFVGSTDLTLSELGLETGPKSKGFMLAEQFCFLTLAKSASTMVHHLAKCEVPGLHLSFDATRLCKREAPPVKGLFVFVCLCA